MKQFCVIMTREGRLRFKFLQLEHGLLHDKGEKKTYAVVRDAYPTNWTGRWSRAYVVYETGAQTVQLGAGHGEAREVEGGTVEVVEPLNMVARIRMPSPRGEDGQVRDVHLTAESIYDRTLAVQVRRLGNRRFQWFHALAFIAVGFVIGVFAAGIIALMSGGEAPPADAASGIVFPSPGAPPAGSEASSPEIIVGAPPGAAQPTLAPPG